MFEKRFLWRDGLHNWFWSFSVWRNFTPFFFLLLILKKGTTSLKKTILLKENIFLGMSSLTLPQVRKPAMWAFDINVNGKSNTNAMQDQGGKSIKKIKASNSKYIHRHISCSYCSSIKYFGGVESPYNLNHFQAQRSWFFLSWIFISNIFTMTFALYIS